MHQSLISAIPRCSGQSLSIAGQTTQNPFPQSALRCLDNSRQQRFHLDSTNDQHRSRRRRRIHTKSCRSCSASRSRSDCPSSKLYHCAVQLQNDALRYEYFVRFRGIHQVWGRRTATSGSDIWCGVFDATSIENAGGCFVINANLKYTVRMCLVKKNIYVIIELLLDLDLLPLRTSRA